MTMYSGKRKMATCKHSDVGGTYNANLMPRISPVCDAPNGTPREIASELTCLVCQMYERDPAKISSTPGRPKPLPPPPIS